MIRKNRHYYGTSPETELLLLGFREVLGPEQTARLQSLVVSNLNWDFIAEKAREQSITAALFYNLQHLCPHKVPPSLLQEFEVSFKRNSAKNLILLRESFRIHDLLTSNGITVVPFKGPIQAIQLYNNIAFRTIADLDFIVRKADFPRAGELLISHGYKPYVYADRGLAATLHDTDTSYDRVFIEPKDRFKVEIHWHVSSRHAEFGLNPDFIWSRVKPVTIVGRQVLSFSPEVMFLLHAVHNEKHHWQRLRFILDAAKLIEKNPYLDWQSVFTLAKAKNRQRAVLLTACLGHTLLGYPLPAPVIEQIKNNKNIVLLAALVRTRLFRNSYSMPGFSEFCQTLKLNDLFNSRQTINDENQVGYYAYLKSLLTPEYFDYRSIPTIPRYFRFLYLFARILRYLKASILARKNVLIQD